MRQLKRSLRGLSLGLRDNSMASHSAGLANKILGIPVQFSKILEGVHIISLIRMNEAHVQITHLITIQPLIEE